MENAISRADKAGAIWFFVMIFLVVGLVGRWIWRDIQGQPLRSATAQECVDLWNADPPIEGFDIDRAFVWAGETPDVDEASCRVTWEASSGSVQSYWALKSWLIDAEDTPATGWDPAVGSETNGWEAEALPSGELRLVNQES